MVCYHIRFPCKATSDFFSQINITQHVYNPFKVLWGMLTNHLWEQGCYDGFWFDQRPQFLWPKTPGHFDYKLKLSNWSIGFWPQGVHSSNFIPIGSTEKPAKEVFFFFKTRHRLFFDRGMLFCRWVVKRAIKRSRYSSSPSRLCSWSRKGCQPPGNNVSG